MSGEQMCPQCGVLFDGYHGLTPIHAPGGGDGARCEGSEQNPRNALSDRRPLWSGEPNPHPADFHEFRQANP